MEEHDIRTENKALEREKIREYTSLAQGNRINEEKMIKQNDKAISRHKKGMRRYKDRD